MPLHRRVPKRGFKPLRRVEYQVVNVGQLAAVEENEISPETLRSRGLIGTVRRPVKVLAVGDLDRALTVRAHAFSAAARAKIESAGGRAEVVDGRSDSGQSD
jgi:large subunit ribosomal protein L15